jgi:hypothetical protein
MFIVNPRIPLFMKEQYHIFWELILIIASILIFRSGWLLLDAAFGTSLLVPLFILGILLSVPPLYILNRHLDDRKKQ